MDLNQIAQRVSKQLEAAYGQKAGRFFGPARKGEQAELRQGLNSGYADQRKEAIQRVLASHTVGKDVSGLFPDVLKNMQTDDLEQKKLVYLYLMSYAKTQPELVILAVNTFVKDTEDGNPLIRALAIRTMGCLRADKIIDYLPDPLRKCLRDDNPYVRKTAAICVVKLYDLKPSLAIEHGFIDTLREMVADSNPMVVANAVAALSEIHEAAETHDIFIIDAATLSKLLIALGECTEWGRIAILGAIAKYRTSDPKEAEQIIERVLPQFQHSNAAVVLAAVKAIMIHMRIVDNEPFLKPILRKMAPPLVTLVGLQPEVAWVALRNINLILQKRSDALSSEMRVFFCRYTDPAYVKVEKLDIMIRLAAEKNVDTLLSELKEYASEVDVDFVRRAIRAIGQCAIKIDASAERCVHVLLELIATRVSYVVQEAIVVIKDIFRKYPDSYEGVIPTLCSSLDDLDEPEAKASLIWILGQYSDRIENADELLGGFVDSWVEEPFAVQLQTLTAIVKLFLKRPDGAQDLVQRVLNLATKQSDNPDIRDRAYIYWRILSTDSGAAKNIVLAHRPPITLPLTSVSPVLLDQLISELGSLAAVYHKPAVTFIGRGRLGADELQRKAAEQAADGRDRAIATVIAGQNAENLLDIGDDDVMGGSNNGLAGGATGGSASGSFFGSPTTSGARPAPAANPLDDLLGLFDNASLGAAAPPAAAPSSSFVSPPMASTATFASPPAAQPSRPAAPAAPAGGTDDLLGLW